MDEEIKGLGRPVGIKESDALYIKNEVLTFFDFRELFEDISGVYLAYMCP